MNAHIENDLPLAVVATFQARGRTPASPRRQTMIARTDAPGISATAIVIG
jgi:hypothetical protein